MAAQLVLTRTANKAQRKLDKPLRVRIKEALLEIMNNPTQKGEKLSQPLTMVYSHHFQYQGTAFRIAYQYNEEAECVVILLIGPHENFYKKVKQLIYANG
ncbi:MAG: type II toxin-antitoxin system RelE/ParE family toxin [Cyanobacteria bacterium HKST-UBA04]|nr:type II toxin-antitoxin system RelE/ParE family toxin [Cyanobacteria bacterium HKST-UBA05]MCA9798935.1 type II toxin-antitoxin system RelE/ParE family toxin [Cyanobacteria bacterium HKST-UBA04]